jgi:hypothetical protein
VVHGGMNRNVPVLLLASSVLLAACGKELGRIPFTSPAASDATMDLAAGEVSFWTDIDLAYEGDASLHYDIELLQGDAVVATATCDPLGTMHVKTGWVETNVGNKHTRSGNGKMSCSVKLAKGGATKVKATLAAPEKSASVTLTKADLVVKQ